MVRLVCASCLRVPQIKELRIHLRGVPAAQRADATARVTALEKTLAERKRQSLLLGASAAAKGAFATSASAAAAAGSTQRINESNQRGLDMLRASRDELLATKQQAAETAIKLREQREQIQNQGDKVRCSGEEGGAIAMSILHVCHVSLPVSFLCIHINMHRVPTRAFLSLFSLHRTR